MTFGIQEMALCLRPDEARRLAALPRDVEIVRVWEGDFPENVIPKPRAWVPDDEPPEPLYPQKHFFVHIRSRFCTFRAPRAPLEIEDFDHFLERYLSMAQSYIDHVREHR
jgi:hypothetical protein